MSTLSVSVLPSPVLPTQCLPLGRKAAASVGPGFGGVLLGSQAAGGCLSSLTVGGLEELRGRGRRSGLVWICDLGLWGLRAFHLPPGKPAFA